MVEHFYYDVGYIIERLHNGGGKRRYDLLYGNMVSNPIAVKECRELPKPHVPSKQQLVGRTDTAERFLQNCLMGCFYFQKNREIV